MVLISNDWSAKIMKVDKTAIEGVITIEPEIFADERGYFFESHNQRTFQQATGCDVSFVQDNQSRSAHKILRGLHYQVEQPQDKLVRVLDGTIYDVAVDLRISSKTFGKWVGVEISAKNNKQILVPKGFAHGFLVLSTAAIVLYKTSDYYNPSSERSLRWDCPIVGIDWPLKDPILNQRDRDAVGLDVCETFS